jgi:hypothetical protein
MKMKVATFRLISLLFSFSLIAPRAIADFSPGEVWRDVDGNPIEAHGGGILVFGNVYYWFGEDRTPDLYSAVACPQPI